MNLCFVTGVKFRGSCVIIFETRNRYKSLVQKAPGDAYNVADEAAVKAWRRPLMVM
jgi:hypothetical protein